MLFTSIYTHALFFFNDTATTEIYTLSLHDALPIYPRGRAAAAVRAVLPDHLRPGAGGAGHRAGPVDRQDDRRLDRKSTRLNSSHANISYAVFCLKKKKIPYHISYELVSFKTNDHDT